eukprot:503612-Pelagomonas_calceolata.AAC.2
MAGCCAALQPCLLRIIRMEYANPTCMHLPPVWLHGWLLCRITAMLAAYIFIQNLLTRAYALASSLASWLAACAALLPCFTFRLASLNWDSNS